MKAEIYSYSRSRGLFAGVSLEGAALQIDDKANKSYYGIDHCTPDKIFSGTSFCTPLSEENHSVLKKKYQRK